MFFRKTNRPANRLALSYASRKEELKSDDGRTLVIVNLSYPVLDGKTPFASRFNDFYAKIADAFYAFASHDLASLARNHPERAPCGAVMRTKAETPAGSPFSVSLETSVFDGETRLPPFFDKRVWDEERAGFFEP